MAEPKLLSFNSVDADTWLTPRWILDQLGAFDLDPCAAIDNPAWTRAKTVYTRDEDGLKQDWCGRVFLNPPYSNIGPWVKKLAEMQQEERGSGIALLPVTMDTDAWFDWVWPNASSILVLKGRIRFTAPDGSTTTGRPRVAVALVAFGDKQAEYLCNFTVSGVLISGFYKL